jgi:hypothetical protein
MSDNSMYDILGKMASLNPKSVETQQPVQKIYESVDARGSILSGVSKVEKRLTDKFVAERDEGKHNNGKTTGFAAVAKKAAKEYGSKSAGERVAGAVRAKMAKAGKLEEHMADGDPTPEECPTCHSAPCECDHEVKEKAPPGAKAERMVKGIKKSLSQDGHLSNKDKAIAYSTTWKAHNRGVVESKLTEGINFSDMVKETDGHVSEMLSEIQKDIQQFKSTGQMSDKLEAFLKVHHHGKKQLQDAVRPEDIPAVQRKQASQNFPVTMGQVNDVSDKISHADNLRRPQVPAPKPTMDAELNELAKLAGLEMEEGNLFTKHLKDTPKGEKFELDGKEYTDTSTLDESTCNECGMYESQCSCAEGNLFTKHLKDTPKGGEFEIDGKKYKDTSGLDESTLYELSHELLKRARDKAGEKWANADDRGDKKASDKYNRQDDKFHSALRKKQKDMAEGQLNELSPELLKRARDKAGEKWANADDRGDKKASDKYNRQDDKFHTAMRKKDMEEGQLNELSPELLKRARDAAGMKWANADDRGDKKASDKYNRQDDKFHTAMRKKEKQHADSIDESMMAMPGAEEDKISVNTNMSTDGDKNVTITASGSKAAELLQMLKLAGIGGEGHEHAESCETCGQSPCACDDEGHEEPEMIAISAEEPVDEAEGEYANVPHEEYQPVDNIIHQGADLNREKSQHPFAAAKGDNPMPMESAEFDPIDSLGRKLMREYNSIKITK